MKKMCVLAGFAAALMLAFCAADVDAQGKGKGKGKGKFGKGKFDIAKIAARQFKALDKDGNNSLTVEEYRKGTTGRISKFLEKIKDPEKKKQIQKRIEQNVKRFADYVAKQDVGGLTEEQFVEYMKKNFKRFGKKGKKGKKKDA